MINYSKYALMLENKAYEARQWTMNTAIGIAKVLSGKDYATYEPQWEQFFTTVTNFKKKGNDGTSTALITHDDGRDMVAITFDIKGGKLDWMSLRCGNPEQRLASTYPGYKGAASVFTPDGKMEGESGSSAPAGADQYSVPVDSKASAANKPIIPYETIKNWADSLAGFTDSYRTSTLSDMIAIFSELLTPDFKKSLGRKAKFAGMYTGGKEEEMDAIAALARAFCDEETTASNRPENWPADAKKTVPAFTGWSQEDRDKVMTAIETVKPEFDRQWGMWVGRQKEAYLKNSANQQY